MSVAETGSIARMGMEFFKENIDANCQQKVKKAGKENAQPTITELVLLLRKQRREAEEKMREGDQEDGDLKKLFEATSKVKNGENILTKEISEEDANLIEERVALQQKQFELHKKREERRKIGKIMTFARYLTEEEAIFALLDCDEDEEEAILRFADQTRDYLHEIRKRIAEAAPPGADDEEEIAFAVAHRQRERGRQKRRATSEDKEKMKDYVYKRLTLNDAMAQLRTAGDNPEALEEAMKDWSPARRLAYKLIDENPNAYYYRFNAPGEEQRNGKWTPDEHELFMTRLKEKGADGEWGIFSMAIPGRVGYQCSNYYRSLILAGRVTDPNYFIDEDGKIRYKFKSKAGDDTIRRFKRKLNKGSDDENGEAPEKPQPKREKKSPKEKKPPAPKKAGKGGKKKRGRKGSDASDDSGDDFGEEYGQWKPKRSFYTTKRLRHMHGELNEEDKEEMQNPLPDFLDPITLVEVVMPAISPSGHVMSWSSWMQCIEHNGKCPLTKVPLKKEDLVKLTMDNIDEYRDRIVNLE